MAVLKLLDAVRVREDVHLTPKIAEELVREKVAVSEGHVDLTDEAVGRDDGGGLKRSEEKHDVRKWHDRARFEECRHAISAIQQVALYKKISKVAF